MATALDNSHTTDWSHMAVRCQQLQDNNGNAINMTELQPLTGITATVAEINSLHAATKVVDATGSTLTVTAALHANKMVTLDRAAGVAVTLPAATGTGNVYTFIQGTTLLTSASHTITAASSSDLYYGVAHIDSTTKGDSNAFAANASSNYIVTFVFTGTIPSGFAFPGDIAIFRDIGTNKWIVEIRGSTAATTPTTPFSG